RVEVISSSRSSVAVVKGPLPIEPLHGNEHVFRRDVLERTDDAGLPAPYRKSRRALKENGLILEEASGREDLNGTGATADSDLDLVRRSSRNRADNDHGCGSCEGTARSSTVVGHPGDGQATVGLSPGT